MQTVETPEPPACEPLPIVNRAVLTRFTRENARAMSLRGLQARRERKERARQAALEPIEPAKPKPEFTAKTLLRVRAQTGKVLDMLSSAKDPQAIDRLAAALAKLAEIERQLSGRPLPGSLRPSASRAPKTALDVSPLPEI